MNKLAAGKGFFPLEFGQLCTQVIEIIGVILYILMRRDHKTKGTTGRVYVPADFDTKEKALSGAKAAEKGLK